MTSIYADAVSNVSIINGAARLELSIASIENGSENKVLSSPAGTLVISLDGFIKLHSQIDGIVKKMLEDGVIKQADQVSAVGSQ